MQRYDGCEGEMRGNLCSFNCQGKLCSKIGRILFYDPFHSQVQLQVFQLPTFLPSTTLLAFKINLNSLLIHQETTLAKFSPSNFQLRSYNYHFISLLHSINSPINNNESPMFSTPAEQKIFGWQKVNRFVLLVEGFSTSASGTVIRAVLCLLNCSCFAVVQSCSKVLFLPDKAREIASSQ